METNSNDTYVSKYTIHDIDNYLQINLSEYYKFNFKEDYSSSSIKYNRNISLKNSNIFN